MHSLARSLKAIVIRMIMKTAAADLKGDNHGFRGRRNSLTVCSNLGRRGRQRQRTSSARLLGG